jgi:hypothetical protein
VKKLLIFALTIFAVAGSAWAARNWTGVQADSWLRRTDRAISNTKSWRMRIESTDPKLPKEWMVIEALPPDREHGWQHVDRSVEEAEGSKTVRIAGDLEYIRIRDDRFFRGDAMWGHKASPDWIKLIPRDFPPLDGFFELRLHMSNPRTIGYSFDSIETSFWSNYRGMKMRRGASKTYSGHSCQEWSYTWKTEETGEVMNDSVCIGAADNLPYHLTTRGGSTDATYEWNPEIKVDAPNPVLPRPKDFITALPDL